MKKQPSPAVIVLMVAGIIVAVGFVFFQLNGGSGPAPVKTLPADTTAQAASPATTQVASNTPSQASTDPNASVASEAVLAPTQDPFQAGRSLVQPERNATPTVISNPAPAPAPTVAKKDHTSGSTVLPPYTGGPMGPAQLNIQSIVKEPELAGTLLGERPSAVFRSDKHLAIVPVGGQFQDWKVVSVQHGAVTLKGFGRTVQLGVGGLQPRTAIRSEEAPRNPRAEIGERKSYADGGDPFHATEKVASYVQTPATGQPVPVTSEPNSITRDLTADAAKAPSIPASPAGQGDPTGQNPAPADIPATTPPPANGNKTTPPADPPANTEKVIDQPIDRPKDPMMRP